MLKQLDKAYDPKKVEDKIYRLWEKSGYFNPDKLPGKRKGVYVIMMAPPNITGHIHIGHALENTLSDVLTRQKRMQGYKALFLPGKDHAGIAANYVLERELKKEGKTRFDLGREKFLERMWRWMKEYGDNIDNELRKIGVSCDWSRKRFTMDEDYQESVKAAFEHYKNKGWIYRGKRIVNWCPRCLTSVSDLEVEYQEEKGTLWQIKYPLVKKAKGDAKQEYIIVATTRPETMLGDAAVAVHPRDTRYKEFIGYKATLPIMGREIPIVGDELVERNFGTGAVKVTPAHDVTDFEIAQKHNLPLYQIINRKGLMTKESKICNDLLTKECRAKVIQILKSEGLLTKEEEYIHNVGFCERCRTKIEPLISEQWFLSMKGLSKIAIKAIQKNKTKFVPPNRKKIMINWFKSIKDWDVARQLWWGHQIPIKGESNVLDTWFSSALWPFATLGWPKKTKGFKEFYPTTLISSAREIFFLWIARMIFSGLEFTGEIPFKVIYTHPTVLDKQGKKMSKSLGNVVDPLTLIDRYGTDAVRFGLVWQTTGNQDIHWSEDSVMAGKKFANKIWNAARFILQKSGDKFALAEKGRLKTAADKKILNNLIKTRSEMEKRLGKYEFGQALHKLYKFFWHDFCDKYLETSKNQMADDKLKKSTSEILIYVLVTSLKLLHPFMPFITEEIYQQLPIKGKKILMIEKW